MKLADVYTPSIAAYDTEDISPFKKPTHKPTTKPFNVISQISTKHETAIHTRT